MSYYHSVKTLLALGKNISEIARTLEIDRKVVRKIKRGLEEGTILNSEGIIKAPRMKKNSMFEKYNEEIKEMLSMNLKLTTILKKLNQKHGLELKYNTLNDYVNKNFNQKEVYIPLLSPPGEEGQVDFGYVGMYEVEGKKKKVWVFCMVLSYSRYAYYELVLDQKVSTFIKCHINAFEYFKGVPKTVKIDNLKAGVIEANIYEPVIQNEYAEFLKYYQSAPITCRVRRGQDKGKVESGIKYVKTSFFEGIETKDYEKLKEELEHWNSEICNKRIHGTTKKIPKEQFEEKEKQELIKLPEIRYETIKIEKRIVDNYGHIVVGYNFYSVPSKYQGKEVNIKYNENVLKVYNEEFELIAIHAIINGTGDFVTKEEHKVKYKQSKSNEYYEETTENLGKNVKKFLEELKKKQPYGWYRAISGIIHLNKKYSAEVIDVACKRALLFNLISYKSVKKICEDGLYIKEDKNLVTSVKCDGFKSDLSLYDKLTGGVFN